MLVSVRGGLHPGWPFAAERLFVRAGPVCEQARCLYAKASVFMLLKRVGVLASTPTWASKTRRASVKQAIALGVAQAECECCQRHLQVCHCQRQSPTASPRQHQFRRFVLVLPSCLRPGPSGPTAAPNAAQ